MAQVADGDLIIKTQIDNTEIKKGTKQTEKEVKASTKNISKEYEKVDKSAEGAAKGVEEVGNATKKAGKSAGDAAKNIGEVGKATKKIDSAAVEKLTQKLDNTNAQIEVQRKKISELKSEYQRMSSAFGSESAQALAIQDKILKAEAAMNRLIETSDKTAAKLWEIDRRADGLSDRVKKFGDVAKGIFNALGVDADRAIDTLTNAWDEYQKNTEQSGEKTVSATSLMEGALKGAVLTAAIALGKKMLEIGKKAEEAARKVEYSTDKMQVALGLTDEEANKYRDSIDDVFKSTGLAQDREDVSNAFISIVKGMKVAEEEAKILTPQLLAINQAFGYDFQDTALGAAILMDQFGISGQKAFDFIVTAAQRAGIHSGEVLDVIKEYSPIYAEMGDSVEKFGSRIASVSETSVYSLNRALDAGKEMRNRAIEQNSEWIESVDELGINAEQAATRIAGGGEIAANTIDNIGKKIDRLPDSAKKTRIMAGIFGEQFKDIGNDGVAALTDIETGFVGVNGAAQAAVEDLSNNSQAGIQKLKNWWTDFWNWWGRAAKEGYGSGSHAAWEKSISGYALGTPYAQYGTYKVGERGIELVQDKKGNSRLVGVNGPQLATLSEGDRVFNAHATKNILERSLNAFDFDSGKISRIANAGIGSHVSSTSKSFSEVVNYNFGKGSVVLEARSIKQLNDIVDLVQNSPNVYTTQSMRKGYTGE